MPFCRRTTQVAAIVLTVVFTAAIEPVFAEPHAPSQFARVSKNEQGDPAALQVAIVSYVPKPGSKAFAVDLIGAVHIGDRAYYAELNERFRDYDVLLYEMIAAEDMQPPPQGAETSGVISGTQVAMKDMLELEFQLDEIDYQQPNFVHADLSPSQLKQSMEDRGESLYVYFWRMFFASIDEYKRDPLGLKNWRMMADIMDADQDNAVKIAIAYELARTGRIRDALDAGSGSAVIDSRNAHAIEVLKQQLDAGAERVGIFYGVAHMPDFEERLASELGLARHKTTWVDAWGLD